MSNWKDLIKQKDEPRYGSNEEWDKGVNLEKENEAMENLYEALWFMGEGSDLDKMSYESILDDIERMKKYILKWQTYHGFKKK